MNLPRALLAAIITAVALAPQCGVGAVEAAADSPPKKVAAIVTAYFHNSHADVIVSRLLETDTLDGKGPAYRLKLAALYTDQTPKNDKSRDLATRFGFPIYGRVADALTLGTGKLSVDGVLLIAEHGVYPVSATGQVEYPKRRLFEEIVKVFEASGRVVPVFVDKHLADNWDDAQWIYATAARLKIPLMAGSSLPATWRQPAADPERDAKLKEIVAVSHHTLDGYGFHALEMLQTIAERRPGGESGIKSVQCLVDGAVWDAGKRGAFDAELLATAVSRVKNIDPRQRPVEQAAPNPVLFLIEYQDGLKASVLTLNGVSAQWSIAWRYQAPDKAIESTCFHTQEERPLMHFGLLTREIEQWMLTAAPTRPLERTLLTSGLRDALLISKKEHGKRLATPYLKLRYSNDLNWQMPPAPPPGRPLDGQ